MEEIDYRTEVIDGIQIIDYSKGKNIHIRFNYLSEPTEENPNPEPVLTVIKTKDEPVLVPTLQYLLFIIRNKTDLTRILILEREHETLIKCTIT